MLVRIGVGNRMTLHHSTATTLQYNANSIYTMIESGYIDIEKLREIADCIINVASEIDNDITSEQIMSEMRKHTCQGH